MPGRFRRVDEIPQKQSAVVGANIRSFASSTAGIRPRSAN
jgi:hypothetical protein